jgi:hypothetical protein
MSDTQLSPDITGSDVEQMLHARGDCRIFVRHCSLCGYGCSFIYKGGELFFDAGCYCVDGVNVSKRTFVDLAIHHNIQTNQLHRDSVLKDIKGQPQPPAESGINTTSAKPERILDAADLALFIEMVELPNTAGLKLVGDFFDKQQIESLAQQIVEYLKGE